MAKRHYGNHTKKSCSILTSELPGYGEKGAIYLSLCKDNERRDISIDEADFNKAFERELPDVIVNSMATSDNPLVAASQTSTILVPKAGSYNFVSNDDGSATLGALF